MSTRRALVCSYHTPQPDRDSGARRLFDFIRFLLDVGWEVTFLAADGIGDERDARRLRQRGVPVYDGLTIDLRTLLTAGRFDLALIAFWLNGERYLPTIRDVSPATRVIVDSVDVHFVREARRLFQQTPSSTSVNALNEKHASQMAREINTYAASDGVLAVSQKETDLVNDLIGDPRLTYTVTDGEEPTPSYLPFSERKGMLSVGSFQHLPNVGAVEYLCKEILPRLDPSLVAEHPVYIVGNALNETVREFAKELPDVRMVGWVPSVEPYFARARISVVPLLYGAGTKRKMIQALMAGTPTVSTRIGVEGLNLQDRQHVLVADDPARFAESITRLLTDEPLWTKLAEEGRSLISETHNPAEAKRRFFEAVDDVFNKSPKARATHAVTEGELTKVMSPGSYQQLSQRLREAVRETIPPDATVLVISKGDPELLKLDERWAWHFPQDKNGSYAGYYPADGNAAVEHLEDLRHKGAEYLVFPHVALWWLDFYPEFKQHLESQYTELARFPDVCLIYVLRHPQPSADVRADNLTVDLANRPSRANGTARAASDRWHSSERATSVIEPAIRVHHPAHAAQDVSDDGDRPRLIAFYLPQFHPIPENDEWWGEGFTEWRNVAKADALFTGHYQPHIPADLGFYDLRCPETREHQSELAREYGIHGFCYYHYWFEGKRLLERPFNEILASGNPDFPFCLCWANDPWSRKWDGRTQDLLMPQTYSPEDDLAHIRCLLPALGDPRAIQVDGRPLFLVYRAKHLPDAQRTTDAWREEVDKAGFKGIYLMAVETAWDLGWDATDVGFDAKVLFQPQFGRLITSCHRTPIAGKDNLQVYDYASTWPILAQPEPVSYRRYETVCPSWDNTARVRENAVVLQDCEPAEYGKWLHEALNRAQEFPESERLVFLNAWNEWAEGCHFEPDLRNGRTYLEETRRVLRLPLRELALR